MPVRQPEVQPGQLTVGVSSDSDHITISLAGELDLATVESFQRRLDAALADPGCRLVVIDLEALEFIDSSGVAVLLRALHRDSDGGRLRVVPSRAVGVNRVLELTGLSERLRRAAGA